MWAIVVMVAAACSDGDGDGGSSGDVRPDGGSLASAFGEAAETAYQETLRLNPRLVEARMNLGVLLSRQGRYVEAIQQLQTALQEAPRNAALWYELAAAQRGAGQGSEAHESLQRVLQLDPRHPRAQADLGRSPQ